MRKNVRIYEARLFNPMTGFRNLTVEDNVHIDLEKSASEPGSPGASAGILEDIDD